MRRSISLLIILLLLGGVLFSGEVTELKFNASVAANNSLGLAKTTSALLLAYQGSDGVYLGDVGAGSSKRVAGGNFNQIAAQGELVIIAYEISKQPFVIVSRNGGTSFERPIASPEQAKMPLSRGLPSMRRGLSILSFTATTAIGITTTPAQVMEDGLFRLNSTLPAQPTPTLPATLRG